MRNPLTPAQRALASNLNSELPRILESRGGPTAEQLRVVTDAMRRLDAKANADNRNLTDDERGVWNALREAADPQNQAQHRMVRGADGSLVQLGKEGSGVLNPDAWRDQNGREVRAYRPDEKVADGHRAEYPDVTIGGFVRSMITGPRNDSEKRALSEGTLSAGGYTVPTPLAREFIDMLRARTVCINAGAQNAADGFGDTENCAIDRRRTSRLAR